MIVCNEFGTILAGAYSIKNLGIPKNRTFPKPFWYLGWVLKLKILSYTKEFKNLPSYSVPNPFLTIGSVEPSPISFLTLNFNRKIRKTSEFR